MTCSENSHYELCGTDCGHTCASSIDSSCEHTCSEGCFCDDGLVRSGGHCVPVEQCGCLYDGFYFNVGEQFWDLECSNLCECFAPNDMRCSASSCRPTMECTGTQHCVVENDSLGNECPLGHVPKKVCPRVKLISGTQLGREHMCARRTREVQTIKPDKSVRGSPTGCLTDLLEGHSREEGPRGRHASSRMSPYGQR
ncbi:unnamed protein product [Leuciscus chuanchicus]